MTTDQITAGANGLWVGGALLVIILIVRGLSLTRKHKRLLAKDAIMLCMGAMCSSFGVVLHRGYWNLAIFERNTDLGYADWAIDQRYIPSAAVIFIITGIVIATGRYGTLYFGPIKWPVLVLGVLAFCGLASVYLAS